MAKRPSRPSADFASVCVQPLNGRSRLRTTSGGISPKADTRLQPFCLWDQSSYLSSGADEEGGGFFLFSRCCESSAAATIPPKNSTPNPSNTLGSTKNRRMLFNLNLARPATSRLGADSFHAPYK